MILSQLDADANMNMWGFNVNIQEPGAHLNNSQIQNKF